MPIINIKTPKGALTKELKAEIHKRIAQVMIETEGRGNPEFAKYVTTIIEEQDPESYGAGGQMVTEELVKAMISS